MATTFVNLLKGQFWRIGHTGERCVCVALLPHPVCEVRHPWLPVQKDHHLLRRLQFMVFEVVYCVAFFPKESPEIAAWFLVAPQRVHSVIFV